MSDLTDFLLARIAEDEADSYRIHDLLDDKYTWPDDLAGCPCGVPARVLAECAAKRRIVALHSETSEMRDYGNWEPHLCRSCGGQGYNDFDGIAYPCDTIKALASVYADHPDFREEWRA